MRGERGCMRCAHVPRTYLIPGAPALVSGAAALHSLRFCTLCDSRFFYSVELVCLALPVELCLGGLKPGVVWLRRCWHHTETNASRHTPLRPEMQKQRTRTGRTHSPTQNASPIQAPLPRRLRLRTAGQAMCRLRPGCEPQLMHRCVLLFVIYPPS